MASYLYCWECGWSAIITDVEAKKTRVKVCPLCTSVVEETTDVKQEQDYGLCEQPDPEWKPT